MLNFSKVQYLPNCSTNTLRARKLLGRGDIQIKVPRILNIRFDEGGLITKPLLEDDIDILIPVRNRGESTENQDQ